MNLRDTKTAIALAIFVLIIIIIVLALSSDANEGRTDLQQISTAISEYRIGDVLKLVWNTPVIYIPRIYLAFYLFWPRGLFKKKNQ